MSVVGPLDAMFLLGETRAQPLHVGGLMVFELPDRAGDGREYVGRLYRELLAGTDLREEFARRVRQRVRDLGYWSWEPGEVELEYHVRLTALPRPGRYRELFELTSRLHGTLLDRSRPLWEVHLIEGLQGRRFAMYCKLHHAMADGVTALRWMQASLTTDPDRVGMPGPYAGRPDPAASHDPAGSHDSAGSDDPAGALGQAAVGPAGGPLGRWARTVGGTVGELVGRSPAAVQAVQAARREHPVTVFRAPRTILNRSITGARRFAAQSWPLERLERVRPRAGGATLNDVLLAMAGGALRAYLQELDALPDKALTAMVPVSLRGSGGQPVDGPGRGNSLTTLIADLATDEPDPARRIARVTASTRHGKAVLSGLSPVQGLLVGAVGLGVAGPAAVLPGVAGRTAPPYNLVISNVPGPASGPLYWNGCRLAGLYPASVLLHGQGLNLSATSYDGRLHVGLTGCRHTVPHLQRLLGHLEDALVGLEQIKMP